MRLVSRDPFARVELHSRRDYDPPHSGCSWCGNLKQTPNGRKYLYRYHVETDGGRSGWGSFMLDKESRSFCSVGCMRSYER